MNFSRRDLLKVGAAGGAAMTFGLGAGVASAQGSELTVAYNVNLPSWDPTVGLSAVNPTIQGDLSIGLRPVYRPGARSVLPAGASDQMGLERGPQQGHRWRCARA